MSKRVFIIAVIISAVLAINSVLSNLANRPSVSVFEPGVQSPVNYRRYDNLRKTNIATIQSALERYRIDNNQYPSSLDMLEGLYLAEKVADPVTKKGYTYRLIGPSAYELSAKMSDGSLYTVTFP